MSSLANEKEDVRYWRSLADLEDSPEFRDKLKSEFPELEEQIADPLSRRRFFQLMGASMAFAGITSAGCRWEQDHIVPLADRPENYVPGVPKYYSTAMELGGVGLPLRVTCTDGRPTKIEGNPDHPFVSGGSNAFAQASILELYDPDRSRSVARRDRGKPQAANWDDFETIVRGLPPETKLRILSEATSSPTIERQRSQLSKRFRDVQWVEYEPLTRENESRGTELYFGSPMRALHRLDRVDNLVTLDSNLLVEHPAAQRYAADFAKRRSPDENQLMRLWSIESAFSHTGAAADHRLPLRSELILPFLVALNARIRGEKGPVAAFLQEGKVNSFLVALVKELQKGGTANDPPSDRPYTNLLVAGERQPPEVHALVAQINQYLGSKAVEYVAEPRPLDVTFAGPTPSLPQIEQLQKLTAEMLAGGVDVVLILGGNPVYDAPVDLKFADALAKVKTSIHLSSYEDETSARCNWHIPRAHYLESWGDTRAYDGTVSIIQPTIKPLFGGKSVIEILDLFSEGGSGRAQDPKQIVRQTARDAYGKSDREWRSTLNFGFVPETAFAIAPVASREFLSPKLTKQQLSGLKPENSKLEIVFTSSSHSYDGRFANNAWLQETPDFLTKLTWDNAALISPRTARELGVKNDTMIEVTLGEKTLRVPAYIMPGQAPYSIALALGHGRTRAGHVAGLTDKGVKPTGVDTYQLRDSKALYIAHGGVVRATGNAYPLASVQDHWAIDKLGQKEIQSRTPKLIHQGTIDQYNNPKTRGFANPPPAFPAKSLFKEHEYKNRRWGMTTDLGKCTGCNACMVACQSENNVPIVGKKEVMRSREMHWIRIDRYFVGNPDDPQVARQPIVCQQCENAPCEQVCPVGATIHTDEGLNDMVYNRCIGTRYCLNNCPYKVRRFNFLDYHKVEDPRRKIRKLLFNPEVTVRSRGVMEKCTFCVQRIEAAKITAKNERRPIATDAVQTACQQACPTGAIVFGDLSDPESKVAKLQKSPRAYNLLPDLHTKPRNKFLALIRNPSKELG